MQQRRRRTGFTLIELLIFSAIFSLIIGAFITILITMVSVQSSQSASGEVAQQGQFLDQQLQYYIESARLVDMTQDVATSTLVLRESIASSSYDPTTFTLSTGTVYLQQGTAGALQSLTSKKVTISSLSFTRHYNANSTSSPLGTDSVSYSFTVSAGTGGQSQYSQTFQSSATVLAQVPKIALIQQAKAENSSPSAASLIKAFPTANESGDMLLAVVAYQGTGTSSIVDTNGNAWKQIASTTTMAPSGTVALYAALGAAAGANTTTASFASTATYTSMFLYEYRGAATASAFDAWGAQTQGSMTTPSSPSVSPTSSVELLFGIDDNSTPISAIFSPGTGYTLETSSTGGNNTQVFTEDMNQDITNPVAASWTSGVLTNSTAMIATFTSENGSSPPSYNLGIVDYWPMNEGSGITAYDSSSNGNNETWSGSTPYYTSGNAGGYGGSFNGNDYVSHANIPAVQFGTGNFSVSFWLKAVRWGGVTQGVIGQKSSDSDNGWQIYNNSANSTTKIGIRLGSSDTDFYSNTAVSVGTWQYWTFVENSGTGYWYVNGAFDASSTFNPNGSSNSGTFYMGYAQTWSGYYDGVLDNVRIYGRALSAGEVQAVYQSGN